MHWRSPLIAVMVVTVIVALVPLNAIAADSTASEKIVEDVPDVGKESSSYCGIYCVYAALNGFGKKTDFVGLLQTKYVGTMYGSSIHELARAVEDHGLHAQPMMGLSRSNLVASRFPIVLHVSRPSSPTHFGHWVLFLGMENGQAKVLDVPHSPELMPVADLLARWDGVGLYISEQPLSPWRLKLDSLVTGENMALMSALLLITALLQRWMRISRGSVDTRSTWLAAPGLLLAAGLLAIAWHFLSADGYARNQVAIRTVVQQHRPSFLPKLDVPGMEQALQDPSVVIVDARYPRDYQAGHLPGAINVPVFTTQVERRRLLEAVPKNARVIVYCQSESCEFDELLSSMLVAEGLENVALFPSGWMKWKAAQPRETEREKGNSHE